MLGVNSLRQSLGLGLQRHCPPRAGGRVGDLVSLLSDKGPGAFQGDTVSFILEFPGMRHPHFQASWPSDTNNRLHMACLLWPVGQWVFALGQQRR